MTTFPVMLDYLMCSQNLYK